MVQHLRTLPFLYDAAVWCHCCMYYIKCILISFKHNLHDSMSYPASRPRQSERQGCCQPNYVVWDTFPKIHFWVNQLSTSINNKKNFLSSWKAKEYPTKKKSLKNRISTPDVWKKKANTKFQLFKKKLLPIDKSGNLQIFMASVVKMSIPNNYREE